MLLKKIIIILGLIFWPLGLVLTNKPAHLLTHLAPPLLIIASLWLHSQKSQAFLYPLLAIPIFNSKLLFLPLIVFSGFLTIKTSFSLRLKIIFLLVMSVLVTIKSQAFLSQSILKLEYEKKQEVLREINLYPNPFMARVFQNKARIITDKLSTNLTALIDPGNYFFSFHPREGVINNQNLIKYPFLAIFPILVGILEYKKIKDHKYIIIFFLAGIFSLSFLENIDRSDFILWLPLTIFYINGVKFIYKSKKSCWPIIFSTALVVNCLIEFIRIFYIY